MGLSARRGASGSCIPKVLSGFAEMSCNVPSPGNPLLVRLSSLAWFLMVSAWYPLLMAVNQPSWLVVTSLHSASSSTWPSGPLVVSEWGWWRANGAEEAFSCFLCWTSCHEEGSATFSGFSQVEGNIDCRIQRDLLIFNSPLPVSRSHRAVTGCGSENVLSPFWTKFPSSDSL